MRCKKHDTDHSSIVGVCATCLRERLFKLILAQQQAQAHSLDQNNGNSNSIPTVPRSVSPYIGHRKSVKLMNPVATIQRPYNKPGLNHSVSEKRFYNSPQVAITTGGCIGGSSSNRKKPALVRFPSISNLFRSNSRNEDADSNSRISVSSCSEQSGAGGRPWFSNVRQKNNGDDSSTTAVVRKQRCISDRGMSPVRTSAEGGGDELSDGSSANELTESCKRTLMKTPVVRRGGGGQKSVTDLIFCPLVSASSHRLLNVKGKPPVDCGFSGDAAVPHLSSVKSYSGNRSRKLVDFGKSDTNR